MAFIDAHARVPAEVLLSEEYTARRAELALRRWDLRRGNRADCGLGQQELFQEACACLLSFSRLQRERDRLGFAQ